MYMQVAEKRAELNGQTEGDYSKKAASVFDLLIHANEQEESKFKLSDEELVSALLFPPPLYT